LIPFKEYTSGESSKEMHIYMDGKESEKYSSYITIKYVCVKTQRSPARLSDALKQWTIKTIKLYDQP
jgi:hypothetical protein